MRALKIAFVFAATSLFPTTGYSDPTQSDMDFVVRTLDELQSKGIDAKIALGSDFISSSCQFYLKHPLALPEYENYSVVALTTPSLDDSRQETRELCFSKDRKVIKAAILVSGDPINYLDHF